ncbi:unnamed protein product, partial [Urochloa humidicola]
ACHRRIRSGETIRWCSVCCKVPVTEGGRHRAAVHTLVQLAAHEDAFGQAVHRKDRFCVMCRLAYCSWSCL